MVETERYLSQFSFLVSQGVSNSRGKIIIRKKNHKIINKKGTLITEQT